MILTTRAFWLIFRELTRLEGIFFRVLFHQILLDFPVSFQWDERSWRDSWKSQIEFLCKMPSCSFTSLISSPVMEFHWSNFKRELFENEDEIRIRLKFGEKTDDLNSDQPGTALSVSMAIGLIKLYFISSNVLEFQIKSVNWFILTNLHFIPLSLQHVDFNYDSSSMQTSAMILLCSVLVLIFIFVSSIFVWKWVISR